MHHQANQCWIRMPTGGLGTCALYGTGWMVDAFGYSQAVCCAARVASWNMACYKLDAQCHYGENPQADIGAHNML